MRLHLVEDPPPPGGLSGRVVLVHGFTQTLATMESLAALLRDRFGVVRVDLPGHGGSAPPRDGFAQAATVLGESAGRGAYVGYSLGGRLCLRLALDRPDLVDALVLVGASPGIADPAERAARVASDRELAAEVERVGVERFLDRWLAKPLFATLPSRLAGRAERLANTPEGLAASLRLHGTGAQEPLWGRLGDLRPPVLLVAGACDHKFAGLAERMAAAVGSSAEVALIPEAGHAAHLERPAEVAALVRDFLARAGARPDGSGGASPA